MWEILEGKDGSEGSAPESFEELAKA